MNVRTATARGHLRPEDAQWRLGLWAGLVGFLIVVSYAGRLEAGKPDPDVLYRYSTAIAGAVQYALILAVVLAIAWSRRDLLALRRPRSWARAFLLALAVTVGIFLSIAILDQFLHGGTEQGLTPKGWQPEHAGAYAANFVTVAVIAPIVEELTFRGVGYSLLERYGRWVAILVVGVTFGLAHGLVQALPELALFGCALAWLRSRVDSVIPGIAVHATFNAAALVAAVTTSH